MVEFEGCLIFGCCDDFVFVVFEKFLVDSMDGGVVVYYEDFFVVVLDWFVLRLVSFGFVVVV